ncbi:conserved hypothetical protein [Pediculus humanus corporis]|uniref:Uncharacterized protein n=1 Tax=Pediculus humanus subsp. corporis TaxID=121224 RepID=E0VL87_PEDHC|nr:uncharacterized protein Phum_PHUM284290 [Pediculus humanus corporis]EEB14143.1 conserved hypothetical protein [Pediculus humanus corporis]
MNSPFKEDREKCWNHRDNYWSCLDKNNEVAEKCLEMRKEFEKHCSKQWVQHFDRRRKYELFKANSNNNDWSWPEEKK